MALGRMNVEVLICAGECNQLVYGCKKNGIEFNCLTCETSRGCVLTDVRNYKHSLCPSCHKKLMERQKNGDSKEG